MKKIYQTPNCAVIRISEDIVRTSDTVVLPWDGFTGV